VIRGRELPQLPSSEVIFLAFCRAATALAAFAFAALLGVSAAAAVEAINVRVDAAATIAANVHGRRIVVRGAIKGDLAADEAIALEEGARVVGDLRAPRVAIAPGGLVRGYVETGHAGEGHRSKAAAQTKKATPVHHAPAAKHPAPPKPASKVTVSKAAPKAPVSRGKAPPPVVPVLKKGTKAALTKKR